MKAQVCFWFVEPLGQEQGREGLSPRQPRGRGGTGRGSVLRGGTGHRCRGTAGRIILCIGNSARHLSCST